MNTMHQSHRHTRSRIERTLCICSSYA